MNTNTENKIEENLDYAIREVRYKINDGNCTINEALYYIGNWQKEKDKAVNDSLLKENKDLKVDVEFVTEIKNQYQKRVQQLEAINDSLLNALKGFVNYLDSDLSEAETVLLNHAKEAIKKAEGNE